MFYTLSDIEGIEDSEIRRYTNNMTSNVNELRWETLRSLAKKDILEDAEILQYSLFRDLLLMEDNVLIKRFKRTFPDLNVGDFTRLQAILLLLTKSYPDDKTYSVTDKYLGTLSDS